MMEPEVQAEVVETQWQNPPKLSDLKADFELAKADHTNQVAKVNEWLEALNPEQPKAANIDSSNPFSASSQAKNKTRSSVKSKLIRKQAEWRYTSLSEPFLNTPDIYNVDPVTHADVAASKQNALVLNNQINNRLKKVAFIDKLARTCVNEGTAIIKTGWDYLYTVEEVEYPRYEIQPATSQEQVQRLQQASQADPSQLPPELVEAIRITQQTQQPHFPVQVGVDLVKEEVPTKNQPSWEICPFNNVYIDPSCNGDMDIAEFVINSFETNKADLEKRGFYQNLDQLNDESVSADPEHHSKWSGGGFEFSDKARKKFVVYEYWGYWDIDGSGITKPIVASWVGNVLIRLEENPYPGGELPFVVIPFMPVTDSLYGEPDGELLKENQAISGAIQRGVIDLFGRSANAQTGFRKGALDALNKRRFERGQDYEFNDMGDAQNSIYMHTFPEIPASVYNFLNMQNQEAESMTGVLSFNEGVSGSGLGSTAAAANGALSKAARRELGILRRMAEGMKEVGRKFIAYNQEFLSEEETVRITDQEFVTVKRDDLAGRFDLRLTISTAEADEQKATELSFMLQTTAQSMGMEFTKIIQAEIADLRKMPLLAQKIRDYQPQPDPLEQQLKQLEIQEKQMEIQKTQAEIQKLLAEAQASGVKSENIQADTDRKNLDFVEQESGVSHARDIDKMEAQSEAQAKTKVIESMLKPKTQ
jgi:hypothetical protein